MGVGQHQPVRAYDNAGARAAGAAFWFGARDGGRCRVGLGRCTRAVDAVATAGTGHRGRGRSNRRVFLILPVDEIQRRLNVAIQKSALLKADRGGLPLLHRRGDGAHQMHVAVIGRQHHGGPLPAQVMRAGIEVTAIRLLHRRDGEIVLAQGIGIGPGCGLAVDEVVDFLGAVLIAGGKRIAQAAGGVFPVVKVAVRTRLFRLCGGEQIAHAQQRVVVHLPAAAVYFLDQIECQPRQVPVGRRLPAFPKRIGFQRLLAALAPVAVQQAVVVALKGQRELDEPLVLRAHARRVHGLPDDVVAGGCRIEPTPCLGPAPCRHGPCAPLGR